jgi:putative selenate reductase molybdopterin-binding subunit
MVSHGSLVRRSLPAISGFRDYFTLRLYAAPTPTPASSLSIVGQLAAFRASLLCSPQAISQATTLNLGGYSFGEHLLVPVGGKVRMRGDPLALVIAHTPNAAEAGAAAVRVDYSPLAHRFELPGPPHASADVLAIDDLQTGDAAALLAGSHAVVSAIYTTPYQAHMATEREAGVAYWEDESGVLLRGQRLWDEPRARLVVIYGSHNPHWSLGYLSAILSLPRERLRVITPPTGGSFGGRQDVYPAAAVALAAYHTGCPVRLEYTRREVMEAAPKRHPYTIRAEMGACRNPQGATLTALRIDIDANTGAYDSAGRYIPGTP